MADEVGEEFLGVGGFGGFFADDFFDFFGFGARGIFQKFVDEVFVDAFYQKFLAEARFRNAFFDEAIFDKPSGEFAVVEVAFLGQFGEDFVDVGVGEVKFFLKAFFDEVVASFFD